jgi:hypothetical protein
MSAKREKIGSGPSARYIRRDAGGRFTSDQVSVGRSHAADQRRAAKTASTPGQGDRGDRR